MARLRSQFWVILVCVGTASGLITPQKAQALGCWGCGHGGWFGGGIGWGGYGGCGGGCGGGAWAGYGGSCGGGCCGGHARYKYKNKMKCKGKRHGCGSFDGYSNYGGMAYAGSTGCGCGAGGYSTGTYGAPVSDPGMGPTYAPDPTGVPASPTPAGVPAPVPPAPDAAPTPMPDSTTYRHSDGSRALTLQSYQLDLKKNSTGVVVYVPEDAVVFVNDQQMKTKGFERHFSADKLQSGKVYDYDIRAEMVRNGAKLVRTQHVALKAGHLEEVEFDFTDTVAPIQTVQGLFPETKLTVVVPEDASVYLAGEDTISVGKVRKFVTDEIANGKAWKDYEVRVEVERNGKTIVKSKKISLVAGDEQELEFRFEGDKKVATIK